MQRQPRLTRLAIFSLMLGVNQLLYAPSLVLLIGDEGWPGLPTAWAALPFGLAPFIMWRSALVGRVWVPLTGIFNTFLAQQALGRESGAWVFLLPSLTLAALLLDKNERIWLIILTALALAVLFFFPGGEILAPHTAEAITRLNQGSVIILTAFIGWLFSGKSID